MILFERMISDEFFRSSGLARRKRHLSMALLRVAYDIADRVLTNSQTMRGYMQERLQVTQPIDVIYNGVDTTEFYPARDQPAPDLAPGFADAPVKLVAAARLSESRGSRS